ncbi:class I SAM-dependent methyltransferase [Phycisphaera mikurensis]|uniref:Putative methyltransferase n=1 Tax=Phycisphaera mikurensis (strain NBRC 102666 / KCTC 22515 / FYK2301M01) TaxID=1142394 RepID=I0IDI4_PHYMF|nr:class I SAM-dependent methyltransferase [Phycisphaera mikurensis]MBB6441142.1 2-polyprenyl-3-methyl-5-hydroxy-6-metoxy-1,4-benzoquinol methylase [Phycisphaera mikurensis]BAM03322.1 putative methyltransferase [Phycisphaera mikurensis NBRC 102666]
MEPDPAFWDRRAPGYDAKLPAKGVNYAARLRRVAEAVPAGGRLLDAGCATGEITLDLAAGCGSVLGIDSSAAMIERAEAKAAGRGVANASFRAVGLADPTLDGEAFDAVTAYSLLHLVDPAAALRRVRALLRPGGVAVTETPLLGDWAWGWRVLIAAASRTPAAPPVAMLTRVGLEAAFAAAGLDVQESRVHNPRSGMHCITARRPNGA